MEEGDTGRQEAEDRAFAASEKKEGGVALKDSARLADFKLGIPC